jgi:hypothetical protein
MGSNLFAKAGLLTLGLLAIFLLIWEITWRKKGFTPDFDDNAALWANARAKAYVDQSEGTVFIGSSRIKFDLDIPTWERVAGEKAIQLAIEGSSPYALLQDLASDEKFKGKLVLDITEALYFSNAPNYAAKPNEYTDYYKKISPSQRASFEVSRPLETSLVFLNKNYLSLNGLLSQADLPARPNVFVFPFFPPEFNVADLNRQSRMLDVFVTDTSLNGMMKKNWTFLFEMAKRFPPPQQKDIDAIFEGTKSAIKKIQSRGGKVLLVRTPCSSPMWDGEQQGFPRDKFWNRLLETTGVPGIHFADYKETSSFICPEWSHLSPQDAIIYTEHLARQIREKGWILGGNQRKSDLTKN